MFAVLYKELSHLVDHVALWVPAFIAHVPVDLHELLQNGTVTTSAFCRESGRVVEMAVDVAFVFVV